MQWKFPLIPETTYPLPNLLFTLTLLYYSTVLINITVLEMHAPANTLIVNYRKFPKDSSSLPQEVSTHN